MMFKLLLVALAAAQPSAHQPPPQSDARVHLAVSTKDVKNPVAIVADDLQIFEKKHQAIYFGHVKAKDGSMDLSCDRMIVHHVKASKEQEITRAECLGHVVVVDRDKWARGDRADFDNFSGVLVVTGSTEARQGNNHVWGEKVIFYKDKDLIEVKKATTLFEKKQQREDPKPQPDGRK